MSAVSRYRIDTAIGTGGMGEVYRGTDTVLERAVAIKFLTRRTSDQSAPEQILSEARSASALSHPNVCTIYEVSESDGRPCIVMEFIDGQSLSTIIPPGVGLPVDTAVSYGIQIADALAHAHDAGVIHRDLKSANIIVTPQQRVKVLDFGLAVQEMDKGVDDETSTVEELASGSDAGTPGTLRYLAPEVLRGERADRQSDIWALGAVLYEMAAGKRPFNGRTPHEISAAILTQSPESLPPEVPSGLRSIIRTCLTKERARRYHSASEVRAALEALQLDRQGGSGTPAIPHRTAMLLGIVLLAGVVVALAMSIVAFVRQDASLPASTSSPATTDVSLAPPATYLAVLPIVGARSLPEQAALTETVVEGMIDRIESVHLPTLKLIALQSALRLQKNDGDPLVRAREQLHATFAATIDVSVQDQHLTLRAALNDARDTTVMWGEIYEGRPSELFGFQADAIAKIVETLAGRLGSVAPLTQTARNSLTDQPTQNFTAYQLYAEGRRLWYLPTATPDGYQKSIAFYDQAIKTDPNFALAYLGKADAIGSMAWEGWIPPRAAYDATREALRTAERLDPALGQAHYTRAAVKLMERDFAGAEAEYRAAISAVPSSVTNRRFYAFFLLGRRRTKDAFRVLQDALERDREGFGTNLAIATTHYWAGDLNDATLLLNELINVDPSDPATAVAREILADVYESSGRQRLAIVLRANALRMNGEGHDAVALERSYAAQGFDAAMHAFYFQQLSSAAVQALSDDAYVSPLYLAMLYIHLGDKDKAFALLDKAVVEGAPWLMNLRVDPVFEPIRSDPRFEPLVRRYETPGLPGTSH